MSRGDQLGRQWRILNILINSKTGRSVSNLASEIDCNIRTIYRDIEALQVAGFPLYDEKKQGKSLWYILESKKNINMPLALTEMMALYIGKDLLNVLENSTFYKSLESVSQKIKSTLPEDYRIFLEGFEKNIRVKQPPYTYKNPDDETINYINRAIEEGKCIDIVYYAFSSQTLSNRRIAPYLVWISNGIFYMTGYCSLRNEQRTFACSRIKEISISDETYSVPDNFKPDDYLNASFGVFHGETTTVKIRFLPEVAKYVKEKKWHDTQKIVEKNDGSIIFTVQTAGIRDIKIWVRSWGPSAEVLEPRDLREMMASEVNELRQLYHQF